MRESGGAEGVADFGGRTGSTFLESRGCEEERGGDRLAAPWPAARLDKEVGEGV
jgi:hypothetical protein